MSVRRIPLLLAVSIVAALGSCDSPRDTSAEPAATPDPTPAPPPGHYEGIWELREGDGPEGPVPIVPGYEVTGQIRNGFIGGNSGCNTYGFRMRISGASVDIGRGGIDQAGCAFVAEDVEPRYIAALQHVTEIARDGDELVLTGPGVRLVFREVAPPPTEGVVGVRWRLEGLITGLEPGAEVLPARPATLTLHEDGTLDATTGCRRFRGTWIEEANTILATELGTDSRDLCPERLREQDSFVVGVLGDGFKARVRKGTLTLFAVEGEEGLVYERN